jgi:hypothetical protein
MIDNESSAYNAKDLISSRESEGPGVARCAKRDADTFEC